MDLSTFSVIHLSVLLLLLLLLLFIIYIIYIVNSRYCSANLKSNENIVNCNVLYSYLINVIYCKAVLNLFQ